MTVPRVQSGGPISAGEQNSLIDQVNANTYPGAANLSQYGAAGITFNAPPSTLLALFELTEKLWTPQDDNPPVPPGLNGVPDVPYTLKAKRIWLDHPENEYNLKEVSEETVLYHPTCLRDTDDSVWSTPGYGIGSRVYAAYNRQSGRWEIVQRPPYISRIEIKDGDFYMPGDLSVEAHLADDPDEPVITVYQASGHHRFGIGRGGSGPYSHAGTEGYVVWNPIRRRWELLVLNGKLICEGRTDETITAGNTGTVSLYWISYATGQLVDSGQNVEALNWCNNYIASDQNVLVSYDRQEDRWTIVNQ